MNRKHIEAVMLKSIYRFVDELAELRDEPWLLALALKVAAEASVFILLLYMTSEVAASLSRILNGLTMRLP